MKRRDFLTAAMSAGLATAAPALARVRGDEKWVFASKPRLKNLDAYLSGSGVKPNLLHSQGLHGAHLLHIQAGDDLLPATAQLGLRFGGLPGFKQGVAFWRYGNWRSWTKPMAMAHPGDLKPDDVQCAYWQYDDGVYGVALPLGGAGWRSTLGSDNGQMITVCQALAPARAGKPVPQAAIGFGKDLYAVMSAVFADAMNALGTPENLREHKTVPEALTWLGWNTWNASNDGHDLSAAWALDQVSRITAAGAPVRTVVLDDGWFQSRDNRLQSLAPDPVKFPGGFKPVVDALKAMGLQHVGVWHAFDGYWNGIDPDSELGRAHAADLFTWQQPPSPDRPNDPLVSYSFLKPDPAILDPYFDGFYAGLKDAGLSLVKVDNQLVAERMAKNNYPVWDLAKTMHGAINKAAAAHFDNALINCMDMTNDAFLNFGTTAVARAVEDYFPARPDFNYDMEHGNAAAHVTAAMYNALYFGEVVFPDFDMFESTAPNASLHAAVRAANCAPIYITDKAGQHNVALLRSLVDFEGRTLRADMPLRPTADCLFQIQKPELFKAWSRVGDGALLLLAHLADADIVRGPYRLFDVPDLPKGKYAVYSSAAQIATLDDELGENSVSFIGRFHYDLLRIAPLVHGRAVLGLKEKLNGLASVRDIARDGHALSLTARDEGTLLIWCETQPASVTVDSAPAASTFAHNLLSIPLTNGPREYRVTVS